MSEKDDADLIPGETALVVLNRHPIVLVGPLWLPVLGAVLALVLQVAWNPVGTLATGKGYAVGGILLLAIIFLTIRVVAWKAETYTLTDQRVILKRGVFSKYSRSISMSRVQDVTTQQKPLGRIFDYGTVEVESAGRDGAEILTYVPRPGHFRNVLLERLHPELNPASTTPPHPPGV